MSAGAGAPRAASPGPAVFLAGAATFALEILGPRRIAPLVGTSIASMTAAIAVVLVGASIGAWIAGRLADRGAAQRAEGVALCLAAVGIALGTLFARPAIEASAADLPLVARALVGASAMCLPASVALGAVPVFAARRAVEARPLTAGVLGRLSAIGTVGGLVGLFGSVALIAHVAVPHALAGVAVVLAAAGLWLAARRSPPPMPPRALRRHQLPQQVAEPVGLARLSIASALVGFAFLSIEVVAVRRVAARVGSSLEAWTAVLAVALLGLAIGAALAGDGAPRSVRARRLASAVGLLTLIGLLDQAILNVALAMEGLPPTARIFVAVACVYGPAFLVLGTLGPRISRAAVGTGLDNGRRLALLSIFSTLGALVGTLATAPVLLPALRSEAVLALAAIVAALATAWVGRRSLRPFAIGAAPALVVFGIAIALPGALRTRPPPQVDPHFVRVVFDEDSPYARVAVVEVEGPPAERVSRLSIDARVHGVIVPGAPLPPRSNFAGLATAIIDREVTRRDAPSLLVLGGGVYAVPRAFLMTHPRGHCAVIELDPAVTSAARRHLGLADDARLRVVEGDARAEMASVTRAMGPVDVVFVDAFGDVSVPWTLTTAEFAREAKATLRPGGTLIMNAIDAFEPGRFVAALHATLRSIFTHVEVVGSKRDDAQIQNFFFIASDVAPSLTGLARATVGGPVPLVHYPRGEWDDLARRTGARVLTDDFAPVESLVSEVVARTMGR